MISKQLKEKFIFKKNQGYAKIVKIFYWFRVAEIKLQAFFE